MKCINFGSVTSPQGLKSQSRIKMNIVRCPPVTMVLIRRPDLRYQLGFSVQNGIVSTSTNLSHAHTHAALLNEHSLTA